MVLRALDGVPLMDESVRRIVRATAHAIAERNGVELAEFQAADDRVLIGVRAHRLAAIGFAAELRRLTNAWFTTKHPGLTLWGEPRVQGEQDEEDDPADWWKGG